MLTLGKALWACFLIPNTGVRTLILPTLQDVREAVLSNVCKKYPIVLRCYLSGSISKKTDILIAPFAFWSLFSVRKMIHAKSVKQIFFAITTVCLCLLLARSMLHISLFIYFSHRAPGSVALNNPRSCHWKLLLSMLIMKKNTNEQAH